MITSRSVDTVINVLNFRKDGILTSWEINSKWKATRPFANWTFKGDTIFVFIEKDSSVMSCSYDLEDSTLILNGSFLVNTNKGKLAHYLSKYVEPYDERLYGPKK